MCFRTGYRSRAQITEPRLILQLLQHLELCPGCAGPGMTLESHGHGIFSQLGWILSVSSSMTVTPSTCEPRPDALLSQVVDDGGQGLLSRCPVVSGSGLESLQHSFHSLNWRVVEVPELWYVKCLGSWHLVITCTSWPSSSWQMWPQTEVLSAANIFSARCVLSNEVDFRTKSTGKS